MNRMTYAERVAAPAHLFVTAPHDEESALVRRAQERDPHAFEHLYRQHVRRVYALCLRLSANVTRAEELTQKAFLTAWEKLPLFRGESAFASWLHRLAVNVVLLSCYTLGCHVMRHLVGGLFDEVSKHPVCDKAYACSSALNYKHQLFAWCSLFSVAGADVYVRLCSMGILSDVRFI